MIDVKPDVEVRQHHEDVVFYKLAFKDWSADIEGAVDKEARFSVNAIRGVPLSVQLQPYQPGQQCHVLRVRGGAVNRRYEVVRVVKSKVELRRKSFFVKIL